MPPLEGTWDQNRAAVSQRLDQLGEARHSQAEHLNNIAVNNARQTQVIEALAVQVTKLVHALEGNGRDGIAVRVDRLERTEQTRDRWKWVWVTALVGAFVVQSVTVAVAVPKALAQRAVVK